MYFQVWNLDTGQRLVTLKSHSDGVTCLQFNDFYIVSGRLVLQGWVLCCKVKRNMFKTVLSC